MLQFKMFSHSEEGREATKAERVRVASPTSIKHWETTIKSSVFKEFLKCKNDHCEHEELRLNLFNLHLAELENRFI